MSNDLIINCPNNCQNNCATCYLKQLGVGSYTGEFKILFDKLLAMCEDKPFDNFHLFTANIKDWNYNITKFANKLISKNKINNYIYIYTNYNDRNSFREVLRELSLINLLEATLDNNKYQLVFSITDPDKGPLIYSKIITEQIIEFTNKFGKPAGVMISYTFTNSYILEFFSKNSIEKISKHINTLLLMGDILDINNFKIAFSIAKPFTKDVIELERNITFYNKLIINTSDLIMKDNFNASLISDHCLINYTNNFFNTNAKTIQVYENCIILTPQQENIINNKCPYTIENILDCNNCTLFNRLQTS